MSMAVLVLGAFLCVWTFGAGIMCGVQWATKGEPWAPMAEKRIDKRTTAATYWTTQYFSRN